MSESGAAVDRGDGAEDDCPLCLQPLPPFWDTKNQALLICCGGAICGDCSDKRVAVLRRACVDGTFGREEAQLCRTCPHCRARNPGGDNDGRVMKDKFEKGQLPLKMYWKLGKRFVDGTGGVERNVDRGMEILKLGADRGDPECHYLIGNRYREGTGGFPESTAEAKRWYLAAMKQGHAVAEFCLALMSRDDGNDAEYLRYLRSSALKGYDDACYNFGLHYYNGENGLTESSDDAKRWFTAAAEQGHATAEFRLAFLFREEGNDAEYVRCMRGSASKGYDDARYNLGAHYYRGDHDLQQSSEEAIRVLTPAAERGHARSMGFLGLVMCQPDPQLPPLSPAKNPNFTKGVHWTLRAAEKGDQHSISNVRKIEQIASKNCFRCNEEAPPEKPHIRCLRCRAAWYCSKVCAIRHWKTAEGDGHRQYCIKWKDVEEIIVQPINRDD